MEEELADLLTWLWLKVTWYGQNGGDTVKMAACIWQTLNQFYKVINLSISFNFPGKDFFFWEGRIEGQLFVGAEHCEHARISEFSIYCYGQQNN